MDFYIGADLNARVKFKALIKELSLQFKEDENDKFRFVLYGNRSSMEKLMTEEELQLLDQSPKQIGPVNMDYQIAITKVDNMNVTYVVTEKVIDNCIRLFINNEPDRSKSQYKYHKYIDYIMAKLE